MKKHLLLLLMALLGAVQMVCAQEAYVVPSDEGATVTFYYDTQKTARGGSALNEYVVDKFKSADITKLIIDDSFAGYTPTSLFAWFANWSKLQTIVGIENLNTEKVTTMFSMFHSCTALTTLDLTSFDTSQVTNMEGMFAYCSSLTSVDLSSFRTAQVTNMDGMFAYCENLTTIYADETRWSTAGLTSHEDHTHTINDNGMFIECTAPLTGGNGTSFETTNEATEATYACIDKADQPGYLTHKAGPAEAEPYVVFSNNDQTITFYYDNQKESRKGKDIYPYVRKTNGWDSAGIRIGTVIFDPSFANCTSITSTAGWFYKLENLRTVTGLEYFNTENVTDMSSMFTYCSTLQSLDLSSLKTDNVTNMKDMFRNCAYLTTLDISGFNTAKVTNMNQMFSGCNRLTSLDVSGFNTANVTDMFAMFNDCSSLQNLDVSKFNTANVTNMGLFFQSCSKLTTLDVSGFNTAKVTNMNKMFYCCSGLTSLDISGFNTANVTDMSYMFASCSKLTDLDFSSFNTAKVTTMASLFDRCEKLTSLDLSSFDTNAVTSMKGMFYYCSALTSVDLSSFKTDNVTNMRSLFYNDTNLKTIYAGNGWSTTSVNDSSNIFFRNYKLVGGAGTTFNDDNTSLTYARIDGGTDAPGYFTEKNPATPYAVLSDDNTVLTFYYDDKKKERGGMDVGPFTITQNSVNSGWYSQNKKITRVVFDKSFADCKNITSTAYWFYHCYNMTTIEGLGNLNTSQVTDMSYMFFNCHSLTSLDLSSFNTASVTNMSDMFWQCSQLTTLDVSSFNTSKVTDMSSMFSYCTGLTSLDLSNFNTPELTRTNSMFQNCSNLTTLNMGNFNTEKVTDMSYMFSHCTSLTTVDITSFNTSNVIRLDRMFQNCTSLKSIDVNNFDVSSVKEMEDMFNGCSNLTTILCNNTWSCENSWNMFLACSLLKGAISYDEEKIDGTYANPVTGYFTAKVIETRCAKPVISMKDGKLILSCETEGVEFVAQVEPLNTTLVEGATISLPNLYRVTVYAKKEGLEDSEPATMDVEMNIGSKGDVDSDGVVDISDAVRIVNLLMGK